ncbi:MAG: hypothetical protein BMS9Abin39_0893 [Ignavibacteria bacterium]|nr:MAG: hypothetical protein BMS9Abin39_0893 [Ignavibacteria bacterium]
MSFLQHSKSIPTLIFVITFLFISDVSAQTEIFGFGGYMMSTSAPVVQGDLQFDDRLNYGLGVDVNVKRGTQVELLWISEQTRVRLKRYPSGVTEDLFDLSVHYFQIGAIQEMGRGKVRPFGAFTVGATLFSPSDPTRGDEWLASITFGGGAKIDMSEKVGIRLQGRILMPLIFSGGGFWCGTGGCGVGVGSWTPLVQFDLTAGIYIKFGGRSRPKSYKDL